MQLHRIISNSKRWIPQIDGLRCLAIMHVLFGHIYGQLYNGRGGLESAGIHPDFRQFWTFPLTTTGHGVELFFVISGYILARPFFQSYVEGGRPVSIKAFYLRRVTRLEPPYILCLLIYLAGWLAGPVATHAHIGLSFLASLFYVKNFFPALPSLDFVTWSLEIEIEFYLLVPLLAAVFLISRPFLRRLVILALVIGLALPSFNWADAHHFMLPRAISFFLTGFLFADLQPESNQWGPRLLWDVVAIVALPIYFFTPSTYGRVPICFILAIVFLCALQGHFSKMLAGAKPIAIIGGMCYSIYLMHLMIMSIAFHATNRLISFHNDVRDYIVQLLVLIPIILFFSGIYYLLIERPCMDPKWPQKLAAWLQHKRQRPQEQATLP